MSELREFIAETQAEAVRRASEFFGVTEAGLQILTPPSSFEVTGLEPRVLVIAQVAEITAELGPVGSFLSGLLDRMGLQQPMKIDERTDGEWTIVRLQGRAGSWLRRQPNLEESLSHLADRIAQRCDAESRARVEIDASEEPARARSTARPRPGRGPGRGPGRDRSQGPGRDRDRSEGPGLSPEQEARLEQQARAAAEAVRSSGEAKVLDTMNSRERWVIHNVLKDERGVRSESVGEGRERRVKIAPA